MSIRFVSLLFFAFLATTSVLGQGPVDPSVSTQVLSDRVAIGEIGQLIIKIIGGDADMPDIIEAPGLEVAQSASRTEMKMINGASSIETIYFYRFRGNQPGNYTIPAFEITIRGRSAQTREIPVTIYERDGRDTSIDSSKPFFAKLEPAKEVFYVNEVVPFTLTAYVRGRNAISDVVSPRLEHESFVLRNFREVRTDGADVGNTYYSSAVIPSTFFALKGGQHRLGPAEIGVRVLDSGGGLGFNAFFQRTVTREMVTNTVNVTVKPLPEGAPASFTGGVGNFSIKAKASTTTVAVGDPVSMEFEVSGIGNLRTMGAPIFSIPQTGIWKAYEPNKVLEDESDSDGFNPGTVRFSRVIIPEAPTLEIPSFHLSYFDPAKSEYVTLSTDPIPLTLTQERSGSSSATEPHVAETGPGLPRPPARPDPQFTDVMHIRSGSPRWIANAGSSVPGVGFYFVQLLFSICFFTVAGFGLWRWIRRLREGFLVRPGTTNFARSIKHLPGHGAPRRDYFRAVSRSLAQWRRENPSPPAEVAKIVDRISEKCAAVLYSGMAEPDSPVGATEASEYGSLLQKLSRRRG